MRLEDLPDRPISPHPNYVTPDGLALIEAELARLLAALAAAGEDPRRRRGSPARPPLLAGAAGRREVDAAAGGNGRGALRRDRDDRPRRRPRADLRIVGEDEADPAKGTLPYVAPLAHALVGKAVGDTVRRRRRGVEIVTHRLIACCH